MNRIEKFKKDRVWFNYDEYKEVYEIKQSVPEVSDMHTSDVVDLYRQWSRKCYGEDWFWVKHGRIEEFRNWLLEDV